MHITFVLRFATMGRKQIKLNVQNPTSTCIRYGDLQWANKTRQGFAHFTVHFTFTLFAFILWERVSDFIEGQHLRKHGKIQWNIERTIMGKNNIRRPQIDSFISHTYYEYTYRPDVHRKRIQSNAGDLHSNVVFEKMDEDTPNSIKRLKNFHEKYMVQSNKQKNW